MPPGYSSSQRYPLIVFLHGSGERGSDNDLPLAKNGNGSLQLVAGQNQADHPAFMLVPQASFLEGWNDNTLRQTLRAIRRLEAQYSIDHDRIYVTGLSLGGEGTYHFAALYPDVFAAAVPMSAWFDGRPEPLAATPIWAFHAADDGSVPASRGDAAVSAIRYAGGRVIYTRYAFGGHGIWPAAYGNRYLLPWLMSQRRHRPATGTPLVAILQPAEIYPRSSGDLGDAIRGTASFPDGDVTMFWSSASTNRVADADPTFVSPLAGTVGWSLTNTALEARGATYMALGVGSSWTSASDFPVIGGSTSVNETRWIAAADAGATPPEISIVSPSASGTWTTTAHIFDLAGRTTAQPGRPVQAVWWSDDRGDRGVAALANDGSWTIGDLDLHDGDNLVTVTAIDSSRAARSAVLLVHAGARPVISAQPQNVFAVTGRPASLAVIAWGNEPLSYQWLKNGEAIPGATSATFALNVAQAGDGGSYSVVVASGGVDVTSSAAVLTVGSATSVGRLINLSVRGVAGEGDRTLIVGFVVSGEGEVPVLVRGWGPALLEPPFGLTGALSDPRLRVFRDSVQVGANDDWGGGESLMTAAARVGASLFAASSKDAAIYTTFAPGANSAHLLSASGDPGIALAEVFEATAGLAEPSPRLVNLSVRAQVATADNVLIGGFVVGGGGPVTVLVRAVGPTLQAFNVGGVLADPTLELYSNGTRLQANDNWSDAAGASAVATLNGKVGFALPIGSKDAALFVTLAPGGYSAVVRGTGNTVGVALLEIYEIR